MLSRSNRPSRRLANFLLDLAELGPYLVPHYLAMKYK